MRKNETLLRLLTEGKLGELREALIGNVREDIQKKQGIKMPDATIIKNLLNRKGAYDDCSYPHVATNYSGSYFAFTDGALVLLDANSNFGYKVKHTLDAVLSIKLEHVEGYSDWYTVDLADVIVHNKTNSDVPYKVQFGDKTYAYNAKLLEMALKFTDSNRVEVGGIREPLYINNGDRKAILMPVALVS